MRYIKLFTESKNYGILYRDDFLNIPGSEEYASNLFRILTKGILFKENDLIERFKTKNIENQEYKYGYSISTSRNKNMHFTSVLKLFIDGTKVSEKYIIKPISYFGLVMKNKKDINRREAEERIFSNVSGFLHPKYILKIQINIKKAQRQLAWSEKRDIRPEDNKFTDSLISKIKKSNIFNIPIEFIN